MKNELIFIKGLNREIMFYIGKNKEENFDVIKKGTNNDLWFHANNISSCHVVAIIPVDIERRDIRYIIKMGALLCKNNTNKIKNIKNIEILYTKIENIEMTDVQGKVITNKQNIIIV
jgi:predicted ribosome quality control (RQC) complex YloA/Tae2 family protein